MKRKQLGALGEKIATHFLKKRGYRILETNFRCRDGEIDIIARKGDYIVFVEVRTKSSYQFGAPEESVTQAKKERLVTSALTYLKDRQNLSPNWRIDIIVIELDEKNKTKRIELIENAIS